MKNHVSDAATEKQNMREKSAVYQLALIVISFIIGYVPFTGKNAAILTLYLQL